MPACANCTVESNGNGNFIISDIPLEAASDIAANLSSIIPAAFVIDIAVDLKMFNKEAAYLLQSGM